MSRGMQSQVQDLTGSADPDYLQSRLHGKFANLLDHRRYLEYAALSHDEFVNDFFQTTYQSSIRQELLQSTPSQSLDIAINEVFRRRISAMLDFGRGQFLEMINLFKLRWDYYLVDYWLGKLYSDFEEVEFDRYPLFNKPLKRSLERASSFGDMLTRLYGLMPELAKYLDDITDQYGEEILINSGLYLLDNHYYRTVFDYLADFKSVYRRSIKRAFDEEIEKYHLLFAYNLVGKDLDQPVHEVLLDTLVDHNTASVVKKTLISNEIPSESGLYRRAITRAVSEENHLDMLSHEVETIFKKKQQRKKYNEVFADLAISYYWSAHYERYNLQVINHGLEKQLYENEIQEMLL